MGCPLVVLTGGDPAQREDLVELVRYGTELGLRVALTPSATERTTRSLLSSLAEAGLARLAVSIDGATAAAHDAFRGVAGSFERSFEILRDARALSLTTQVNTTVTRFNVDELEAIAAMLEPLEIELWSVFFVVPTGRAQSDDVIDRDAVETVLERLATMTERVPFDIKTTAAPHFRRVLLQRKARRDDVVGLRAHPALDGISRAPRGVNDGQGILFVSHEGAISPSGFLPIECGNVRTHDLASIYREHPLFTQLRDPDRLEGKCEKCEFRRVCGGSRARAWAMTGNPFAEEPSCAYLPRGYSEGETAPTSERPPKRSASLPIARSSAKSEPIVVLGAGVSGLAAALGAQRNGAQHEVIVVEASPRAGGVIRSEAREGGWLIEHGPDAFVAKPSAIEAIESLGLGEQIVTDGPAPRRSFIERKSSLYAIPQGVLSLSATAAAPLFASGLLSTSAKLRWLAEGTIRARDSDEDESIAEFVARRFGAEFHERLVDPLLRGVYGAPTNELSAHALLPQLVSMERLRGSISAALARPLGPREPHPPLATLRHGMQSLIDALTTRIHGGVRLGVRAQSVRRLGDRYRVDLGEHGHIDASRVIFATPPWVSAALIEELSPSLASVLHEWRWTSQRTLTLGVKRTQIQRALDGTGWVSVRAGGALEACTWSSRKWPDRAPPEHELLRCFLRKDELDARAPEDDEDVIDEAVRSLRSVIGLEGAPLFRTMVRRDRVLPIFSVGHKDRVASARAIAESLGGITLTGNGYDAMGIGDCLVAGLSLSVARAAVLSASSVTLAQ